MGEASLAVRRYPGRVRTGFRAELDATSPLEAGERVVLEAGIQRRGELLRRPGYLRLTDRRLFLVWGRYLSRNEILEIPRALVRGVRTGPTLEPVIRIEVAAPLDDELLAFRARDAWGSLIASYARGPSSAAYRRDTIRTAQLQELLLLALGPVAGAGPGDDR